jgi:hypothetical protein
VRRSAFGQKRSFVGASARGNRRTPRALDPRLVVGSGGFEPPTYGSRTGDQQRNLLILARTHAPGAVSNRQERYAYAKFRDQRIILQYASHGLRGMRKRIRKFNAGERCLMHVPER